MAKMVPAMGALKVAAMPAAAPQATSVRTRSSEKRSNCPTVEPSAEPTWTIGPSRPAEPPAPMVSDEASTLTAATRGRMRPTAHGDGLHHLGHAVAFGFAGPAVDHEADEDAGHGHGYQRAGNQSHIGDDERGDRADLL